MSNVQVKPVTDASSARRRILDVLSAPKAEGSKVQADAKLIALLGLFEKPDEGSFRVLDPEEDRLIEDVREAKQIAEDAEIQRLELKVEAITRAGAKRYLIASNYTDALDCRVQQNAGSVTIKGPKIPEVRKLVKDFGKRVSFAVSGITPEEFIEILGTRVDRSKYQVVISEFESKEEAKDLLTDYTERASFKQAEAFRLAQPCKVPQVAKKK